MEQHQQFQSDLNNAVEVIHQQINRLSILDKKFNEMDVDFRKKIAESIKLGNNAKAKMLATELANIHKVQGTTQNMNIALEVVVLRCTTINEFAMVMDTIDPTIQMIKDIQKDISKVVPTANNVINDMTKTTSEVLMNCNIEADIGKISTPMDEEAFTILSQVEELVEDETKSKLPEVPNSIKTKKNQVESVMEEHKVMIET